jgi:hypothetical protein
MAVGYACIFIAVSACTMLVTGIGANFALDFDDGVY